MRIFKYQLVISFIIILALVMALGQTDPTQAQSLSSTSSGEVVAQKQRLDREINSLTVQYRSQLETYRQAEKQFNIDYDTFLNTQTLAAIEKIVNSSKQVLIRRDEVLVTYLNLLRTKLVAAPGVEIKLKQISIDRIEGAGIALDLHLKQLNLAASREDVNISVRGFIGLDDKILQVSQEALGLLSIGKLQSVYDQSVLLRNDLATSLGFSLTAAQSRDLSEIDRSLNSAQTLLGKSWENIDSQNRQLHDFSRFYGSKGQELQPVYVNLLQTTRFLSEMSQ